MTRYLAARLAQMKTLKTRATIRVEFIILDPNTMILKTANPGDIRLAAAPDQGRVADRQHLHLVLVSALRKPSLRRRNSYSTSARAIAFRS